MCDAVCMAELRNLIDGEKLPVSETMVWGSPAKEIVCRSLVSVTLNCGR